MDAKSSDYAESAPDVASVSQEADSASGSLESTLPPGLVQWIGAPVPPGGHQAVAALAAASSDMVVQPAPGGTIVVATDDGSGSSESTCPPGLVQGIGAPVPPDGHEAVAALAAASSGMVAQPAPAGTNVTATDDMSFDL